MKVRSARAMYAMSNRALAAADPVQGVFARTRTTECDGGRYVRIKCSTNLR
jgi:hypothetical protein